MAYTLERKNLDMSDFRKTFYQSYMSTFKEAQSRPDDWSVEDFWKWCEYKYLPLLKGVPHDAPILELGCGAGLLLEFLRRQGYSKVEGIDVSPEQIERAKERRLNAEVADVFEFLQSKENLYGAILAIDFVEHFTRQELLRLIPLVYKALLEKGVFILQTANGQGLFPHPVIYGDLTHMTILSPASLGQLLRPAGFQEIQFYETGPVPKNFKGKVRVVLWKLIKLAANSVRIIETGKTQESWTTNVICRCRKPHS